MSQASSPLGECPVPGNCAADQILPSGLLHRESAGAHHLNLLVSIRSLDDVVYYYSIAHIEVAILLIAGIRRGNLVKRKHRLVGVRT